MKAVSAGNVINVFLASDIWPVNPFHIVLILKTRFLNLKHNPESFRLMQYRPQAMPVTGIPLDGEGNIKYGSEARTLISSF
jgi:hypothetical protein